MTEIIIKIIVERQGKFYVFMKATNSNKVKCILCRRLFSLNGNFGGSLIKNGKPDVLVVEIYMKNTKDQNIFALLLPACKIDTYQ